MHAKVPEPLSQSEWKVMKIVWQRESCAARDVYQKAGRQHGWAPTTVKTMLRRLVEKGYLNTTRIGNSFLYRPTRPAIKALVHAADALLENATQGTVAPFGPHGEKEQPFARRDRGAPEAARSIGQR